MIKQQYIDSYYALVNLSLQLNIYLLCIRKQASIGWQGSVNHLRNCVLVLAED